MESGEPINEITVTCDMSGVYLTFGNGKESVLSIPLSQEVAKSIYIQILNYWREGKSSTEQTNNPKPRFACNSLIYEGDLFSELCPKCGSSMARKWIFFKTGGCIQPECSNYSLA